MPMLRIMKRGMHFGVVALLSFVSEDFAGTTGKLSGKVVDKSTKDPLPGVNVQIMGTALGGATSLKGEYIILNIPPGSYSVRASFVGYGEVVSRDVRISIDVTTPLNFELAETTLELGETVEVVAQRELIQKDLTATTAIVDDKSIQSLPVTEINEVITLQAGVVEKDGLHIRGGRKGEVAFWIDGVPVTDAYDGGTVVDVNKNLVQELQVISGAFNAEYGQALSGVVNIATKEASEKFGGSLTTYFGDYVSNHEKLSWGPYPAPFTAILAPSAPLFRDIKNFNAAAIRNFEGSLYGPLLKDKLSFNVSGRYIYFDGWLRGQRIYNPHNVAIVDSAGVFQPTRFGTAYSQKSDSTSLGDGEFVPMNWNRKIYGQGKLIYQIRPTMKLTYTGIIDDVEYQDYDRDYTLNPDGNVNKFRQGLTNILKLTHTLSNRTFYDLAFSYTEKLYKEYAYEDIHDPRYVHPRLGDQEFDSFKTGGVSNRHFNRRTSTALAKFDLTSQATNTHQFKIGGEFRRHRVFFEDIKLQPALVQSDFDELHDSPFIETRVPDLSSPDHDRFTKYPIEASAYLQDKLELQDFIVNIGVRLDYFEPDGKVLADPSDPDIYDPIRFENRFHDLNGNQKQDPGELSVTVEERRQYWYKPASTKSQVSPRLGVSFPVTAGGVFHFSYGQFFQIPKFERLYQNSDFKIGSGTGNQGLIGNADLKPEQTTNYEIGLKQEITDDSAIEVTAFFRDIRDLTSTRAEPINVFGGAAEYNKFVNADFGLVRGVILSYDKRLSRGFSVAADYTFQFAKASNSDPEAARRARNAGDKSEVQLTPVEWDQTHTLNVSATYTGNRWGAGLIVQAASGQPYTPRRDEDISTLATNSERKPSNLNVDLRLYKDFSLVGLNISLFARVLNLFDTLNEVNVFDDTGQADFTTYRNRDIHNSGPVTPVNTVDAWFTNATYFSEPRRIEVGTTVTF
jgi:outer membrane receptor protein involved in Fe transport